MKNFLTLFLFFISVNTYSYYQSETVDQIIEEATDNSQLEQLAHELFDLISGSETGALIAGTLVLPANQTQLLSNPNQKNALFANASM